MGRLCIKDFEGPAYKCKYCPIEFALYHDDEIIKTLFNADQPNDARLYNFPKCFNVEIGTVKMIVTIIDDEEQIYEESVFEVFCIGCGSRIGWFNENEEDTSTYFYLVRTEIHAPPEGSDNENPQH